MNGKIQGFPFSGFFAGSRAFFPGSAFGADDTADYTRTVENYVAPDVTVVNQDGNSALLVLSQAIRDYRDYFFDVIGMMTDQNSPAYVRLSFGPGQRYASKGCYIVRLSKGAKPELVRMSDWVIH